MWHFQVQEEYPAGMSAWTYVQYLQYVSPTPTPTATTLGQHHFSCALQFISRNTNMIERPRAVFRYVSNQPRESGDKRFRMEGEVAEIKKKTPLSTHILLLFGCFGFQYSAKRLHTRE